MKPQRKDVHINHSVADGINQPVLISNTAAPKALQIIFKWFGFSFRKPTKTWSIGNGQATNAL